MKQPYVRPGIDDRPDYEKALSPEEKAALARLAVKMERRAPESSADQAETQASRLAAASSPASAVASVDAAVPDMTSSFLDMRDPMLAANGERPDSRAVTRLKWGFAVASLLTTVPWVALTMVALPAAVARAVWRDGQTGPIADVAVPLGWIVAVGAVAALLVTPLVAAVSDHTRTRFGKRSPWVVAGGVVCALLTLILGATGGVRSAGVFWVLLSMAHVMLVAPVDAAFAERVPDKFRVSLVRWRGVAQMLGQAVGAWVGTLCFAFSTRFSYETFAVAAAVFALAGVAAVAVCPREPSSEAMSMERIRWAVIADQLRPPRNAPRFGTMYAARLCMMAAVGLTGVFLWYIVRYYAGADGLGVALTMDLRIRPWAMVALMALCTLVGAAAAARAAGPINESFDDVRRPMLAACVLYAMALVFPCVLPNAAALGAFALITGFAFGLYDALGQELVMAAMHDPRAAGHDLGVFNTANTLGLVVAAALGAAALAIGGFVPLFVAAIVLVVAAAALMWKGGAAA